MANITLFPNYMYILVPSNMNISIIIYTLQIHHSMYFFTLDNNSVGQIAGPQTLFVATSPIWSWLSDHSATNGKFTWYGSVNNISRISQKWTSLKMLQLGTPSTITGTTWFTLCICLPSVGWNFVVIWKKCIVKVKYQR